MLTPQSVAQKATAFATLPEIYARIRQTLDNPASTHADIADVIGTDPAVTARVLKIANSAFYSRPGTIAKISQAVGLLGTQQVHDLVLATVVIAGTARMVKTRSALRDFWQFSVTMASASKLIAEECGILDSERMFVAGLISQLGQLVIEQVLPEDTRRLRQQADLEGTDPAGLQRQQFGFDHAAVAAVLFEGWNLPPGLVEPIHWHTQPAQAGEHELEASILHIAAALTNGVAKERSIDDMLITIDESAWQSTELNRQRLSALKDDTLALSEAMAPVLIDLAA